MKIIANIGQYLNQFASATRRQVFKKIDNMKLGSTPIRRNPIRRQLKRMSKINRMHLNIKNLCFFIIDIKFSTSHC